MLAGAEQLPLLRVIVTLDNQSVFKPPPGDLRKDQLTKQWGAQRGIKVISWQEALDIGAANPAPHMPPKSNEVIASYCYTSVSNKSALVLALGLLTLKAVQFAFAGHDGQAQGRDDQSSPDRRRSGCSQLPL